MTSARKTECPNFLHDWPLPTGYVAASITAEARLSNGWNNAKCPDCSKYGWIPSNRRPRSTNPVHVTIEMELADWNDE